MIISLILRQSIHPFHQRPTALSMAQVIKVTTTKPLPPGAETVAKGGKEFFQIKRAGKTIYCELTECKTKYRIESRKWYAQYRDATGRIKRKPAFTDKGASSKLAQELEERAMRRKMGLPGSAECIFEEPVDGLLDRFEKFCDLRTIPSITAIRR